MQHDTRRAITEASVWRLITRGTWYVLAAAAVVVILLQVRSVVVQAIIAMIISAAVTPIVDAIILSRVVRDWRWKPGRAPFVLALYLVLGVIALVLAVVLAGTIQQQLAGMQDLLPQDAAEVEQVMATSLPSNVPPDVQATLTELAGRVFGLVESFVSGLVGAIAAILGETLSLFFVLILAVYFAADGERIQRYLLDFVPAPQLPQAARVMDLSGRRLGAWVRGQVIVCTIVGALFAVGLAIIGVPFALLLGFVAFVGEFIPLVGPFISSIPAVAVAFLAGGVRLGVVTAIFCLVVEQLEGDLIVPRIMGSATSIHPVAVLLAILAGAQLGGATGALLAVPVAGFIAVVVDEVRLTRGLATPTEDGRIAEPTHVARDP
ncbi:MAG TPA: AI-2E family transporter [Chloroflexota bacterium]|jgi:predicted PurR-regulated permease PerM